MAPRGIRNNNPGNIRAGSSQWRGMSGSDDGFVVFSKPEFGIRAMVVLLQGYADKHNIREIRDIIARWAPPAENDTLAYVAHVVRAMRAQGFDSTVAQTRIDAHDYDQVLALVRAMVTQENGYPDDRVDWYTADVYERGLRMAGLSPRKPIRRSRTVQGAGVAATSIVAAQAVLVEALGVPQEIADLLPVALGATPERVSAVILLIIALAGVGYSIWSRIDDQRQGRL